MPECKVLKNHMCATVAGRWRPCCAFKERWEEGSVFFVENTSFNEYRTSPFYQNIIDTMQDGWHPDCHKCQDEEARGTPSMRQRYGALMSGEGNDVEFLDISLSNDCNLSCKMCGPWASTTWDKLVKTNAELEEFHKPIKIKYQANIDNVFNGVNLEKLTRIKLLGGEPFITPQTTDFFEYLDSRVDLKNITIQCNTNATFFPKRLIKYLEKFRQISISISIDGFEKNNDYVRSGSKWDEVLTVIHQWIAFKKTNPSAITLRFTTCLNVYNIQDSVKIINLAKQLGLNYDHSFIRGPEHLSISALPTEYVDYVKSNLILEGAEDHIIKYLNNCKYNSSLFEKLKRFTKIMDNKTGLCIRDYNPVLAKYLIES